MFLVNRPRPPGRSGRGGGPNVIVGCVPPWTISLSIWSVLTFFFHEIPHAMFVKQWPRSIAHRDLAFLSFYTLQKWSELDGAVRRDSAWFRTASARFGAIRRDSAWFGAAWFGVIRRDSAWACVRDSDGVTTRVTTRVACGFWLLASLAQWLERRSKG